MVGITLQLYDHGAATHRKGACCAGRDIHDARNVAERIGIPHYVLDYESRFREAVIDNFADSYALGETPVPCIECNRSVKFRDLLATARELGAAALATGHYVASRRHGRRHRARWSAPRTPIATRAISCSRPRASSSTILRFPLGDMTKPQVREMARRFDLEVADKQDSQDICFVPTGRYTDIIGRLRPDAMEPGDIVDLDGRVHRPAIRASCISPSASARASASPPARRFTWCGSTPRAAASWSVRARRCGWTASCCATSTGSATGALDRVIGDGIEMFVRVRSTRPPQPAWLRATDGGYEIELVAGEEGVSPGQACVFYDAPSGQARVLGGGFIKSATARHAATRASGARNAASGASPRT